jgi:uncharacterized protein (DUF305 family)
MNRFFLTTAVVAVFGLSPLTAMASETSPSSHVGHTAAINQSLPASTQAYMQVNDAMHRDMAIDFTGNADVDFLLGMIPHHQGAVEMARVVLEHGTDPEVRKLAEAVIAAQTVEIEWMQERLRALGN